MSFSSDHGSGQVNYARCKKLLKGNIFSENNDIPKAMTLRLQGRGVYNSTSVFANTFCVAKLSAGFFNSIIVRWAKLAFSILRLN